MWLYYGAIGLVVVSNAFYHLAQKSTPAAVNPFLSLTVTYLTAAAVSVLLLLFQPATEGLGAELKRLNWASAVLGVAIVGLELGFLLAYRAGWNVSLAQVFATILVTLVLIPMGVLLYHERLSLANAIGILLCVAGVILVGRR